MRKHLRTPLLLLLFLISFSFVKAQKFKTRSVEACAPLTANLTAASVTAGSDPGLVFTYWKDAQATVALIDSNSISVTGRYYIMAKQANGSNPQILPVDVTIGTNPDITILKPVATCSPKTIDLTTTVEGYGDNPALFYYFYLDQAMTKRILDPKAVVVTSNTIFYLQTVYTCGCHSSYQIPVEVLQTAKLVLCDPAPVCYPQTVNLFSAISAPDAGFTYTYYTDSTAKNPLIGFDSVRTSGTYYIKASNTGCCPSVKAVHVTVNPGTPLLVCEPAAVCAPITIKLSTTITNYTSGLDAGITYTYYTDQALKHAVPNPDSVSKSGTYYIEASTPTCCPTVKCVHLKFNEAPKLVVTDLPQACVTTGVKLSATIQNYPEASTAYAYFSDAALKIRVLNPDSVKIAGTYYIQATSLCGCSAISPVHIQITPLALLSVADPSALCTASVTSLQAAITNYDASYTYSYYSDASLSTVVPDPAHVSGGTYYIRAASCTQTASCEACAVVKAVHVSINALPALAVSDPPPICVGASIKLSASIYSYPVSGITYSYFTDSTLKTQLPDPDHITVSGKYFIQAINATGCRTFKSVNVLVNPLPSLAVVDPAPVCGTNGVNLAATIQASAATAALTYSYYSDASLQIAIPPPGNVTQSGTYYIKALNAGGCQSVAQVHVKTGLLPDLAVTDPAAVCQGEAVDLSSAVNKPNTAYNYTYYSDAALQSQVSNFSAVNSTGTYYVKAVNAGGCQTVATIHVKINPLPILKITDPADGSLTTASLTSAAITAGSDAGLKFNYFIDAGLTTPASDSNHITQSGVFYILATNPVTGCVVKGSVKILLNTASLFIPTLFTPNGDGINDTFVIKGIESYPDNNLEIFNRWGNKVFAENGYGLSQKNWNGSGLLEGTYYYVLKVRSGSSTQTRSGWTMILTHPIR